MICLIINADATKDGSKNNDEKVFTPYKFCVYNFPLEALTRMSIEMFCSVNFSGQPGQMSPPNPIDKVSFPESSHSGHGKIESSKVGHNVSFDLHPETLLSVK